MVKKCRKFRRIEWRKLQNAPGTKKYPKVDVYVPVDGEIGFSNIVEQALKADSKKDINL